MGYQLKLSDVKTLEFERLFVLDRFSNLFQEFDSIRASSLCWQNFLELRNIRLDPFMKSFCFIPPHM